MGYLAKILSGGTQSKRQYVPRQPFNPNGKVTLTGCEPREYPPTVDDPSLPVAAACSVCGSPIFYAGPYGNLACENCHPPISPAMVRRRLMVVEVPLESPENSVRFAWEDVGGGNGSNGSGGGKRGISAFPQATREAGGQVKSQGQGDQGGYLRSRWPASGESADRWFDELPDNPPLNFTPRASKFYAATNKKTEVNMPIDAICVGADGYELRWHAAAIGPHDASGRSVSPGTMAVRMPLAAAGVASGVDLWGDSTDEPDIDPFGLDGDAGPVESAAKKVLFPPPQAKKAAELVAEPSELIRIAEPALQVPIKNYCDEELFTLDNSLRSGKRRKIRRK